MPLGPGAVIVCPGCAQVNMIGNDLLLDAVTDPLFIDSDPVRDERWRVVHSNELDPPPDLVRAEARAQGDDDPFEVLGSSLSVLNVHPSPTGLPYGYALSHGAMADVEFVVTGIMVDVAEFLFRSLVAAWPLMGWPGTVGPGTRFTFASLADYELTLAPVPPFLAGDIGLPGGVTYLQLIAQDDDGLWPWDDDDAGWCPVMASRHWRPTDEVPVVLDFDGVL